MAEQYEYNEFVPDVHFELIPIKMLVSNQTYQRPISIAHVGRTAQNFNIYQINPVKVSRREGTNYVFDGQLYIILCFYMGIEDLDGFKRAGVLLLVCENIRFLLILQIVINHTPNWCLS